MCPVYTDLKKRGSYQIFPLRGYALVTSTGTLITLRLPGGAALEKLVPLSPSIQSPISSYSPTSLSTTSQLLPDGHFIVGMQGVGGNSSFSPELQ